MVDKPFTVPVNTKIMTGRILAVITGDRRNVCTDKIDLLIDKSTSIM